MSRIKAFTLLELIVVIIIIGILGTFGFAQYENMLEKARDVEAIGIFKALRPYVESYYLEYNELYGLNDVLNNLTFVPDMQIGTFNPCRAGYYFSYSYRLNWLGPPNENEWRIQLLARRCTTGGKPPQGKSFRYLYWQKNFRTGEIVLNVSDTLPVFP